MEIVFEVNLSGLKHTLKMLAEETNEWGNDSDHNSTEISKQTIRFTKAYTFIEEMKLISTVTVTEENEFFRIIVDNVLDLQEALSFLD